jgi:hypothetical protein
LEESNKSVGWVAAMLALTVAYFGWGFLAADYFQNDPTQGPSRVGFWENSIEQIPNAVAVMSHAFRDRLWLVGLIIFLEFVVFILWRVLKKLERELWEKK